MSLILKSAQTQDDWAFENGKEKIYWDENPFTKHIILTSPMTRARLGYNRHATTNPKEMDRLFTRVSQQEHEANGEMIEKIYTRGREYYEAVRGRLHQRLASTSTGAWEKAFIRESLKMMDERDFKMQQNTVHGVSALQTTEAALSRTRVN